MPGLDLLLWPPPTSPNCRVPGLDIASIRSTKAFWQLNPQIRQSNEFETIVDIRRPTTRISQRPQRRPG
jgi:hypothetical protein